MIEAIPAATLVLFRDRAGAAPELLITQRAAGMVFAGGALVFPGGRIDPEDRVRAAQHPGLAEDDAAARIAALRETVEEVGFDFGLGIHDLTPFARWLPKHRQARNFDTRFYIAQVPVDAPEPQVDGGETVRAFWSSAADVLAMCDRGEAEIIFPTRRNLERLAQFDSFDAAVAHALAHPIVPITPFHEEREDGPWLCIPDGLGYPVTAEKWTSVMRG
ncbi:NUDIX hydrolase [Sphingomonas sp.]|uniref:NUDIX hydrolase n=1 Tax=Sphingomonas sp. TaxID=28214 RepID=UPI002DBD342C|nr:NUDIX domain-containing protein [Sphingomonas sp.]HEU4967854.1 NUDIX domain-containing protein [Sphingomonas sp.]